jgi:hypothetical protein
MDGFQCWRIHRAVVLHLTSLKYDMVAQRGNVKGTSPDRFAALNSRYIFQNIARNLRVPNEAVHFFISNIVYSNTDDVYDSVRSWENYSRWIKEREMTTQLILDDLDSFQFEHLEGNPPELLKNIVAGTKSIHTAVAINRYHPFIDQWIKNDYFTFNRKCIIIKKLDKFVKYKEDKISIALLEKENETV